jgi:uncharacterized membrane protein
MSHTSDGAGISLSGFRDLCCTVSGTLFLIFASAGLAAAQRYTFMDLGAFEPRAIAGPYIVGIEAGLPTRLNLETGQKLTLGHFGQGGTAESVIPTGEAVGTVKVLNAQGQPEDAATFWQANGTAFLLPGPRPSQARDLNEAGTVAGYADTCPRGMQAVRWWPAQERWECSPTTGAIMNVGLAIDGADRIWGMTTNIVTVWDVDQTVYHLIEAGGVNVGVRSGNEVVAVGLANTPEEAAQAVQYRFPPAITRLPFPFPPEQVTHLTACNALGANAAMATVGSCGRPSADPPIPFRAFLWPDPTSVVDLNTLVQAPYVLATAVGINDDGEIIGSSPEGNWLLTPISQQVAQCGGAVPCQCGDTVAANYTFPANLTCAVQGFQAALVLAPGVQVNGNGHRLIGTGGGIGVLMDGIQESLLTGLNVTGFAEGVKLRAGASANTVAKVQAFGNLASLVFEQANRNTVTISRVYGDAGLALAMTDSHENTVQATCIDGPVALQNSTDNLFRGVAPKCPPRKSHVASR